MINIDLKKKIVLASKYPKTAFHEVTDPVLFGSKATPFPRIVNCFITEKCNFNCPMCHVKHSRLRNLTELKFKNLKPFFDNIAKFSPSVSLAGGEPLMHPEIIKIIQYISRKKMVKGLVTNGLLLEKMSRPLIDSGLDFLAISLDGPDEATQYKRGLVKNSFEKIISGIKKVVKDRKNSLLPNIRIATVISKANLHNFDKIYNIALDLGVDQWSISHHFYYFDEIQKKQDLLSKKKGLGNEVWGEYNGSKKIYFNTKEQKLITSKLEKISLLSKSKKNHLIINLPNSMDIKNFYNGCQPTKQSVCRSPFNQIFLRGNGDVEICHGYILGNIKNDNLKNIWNNQKTKYFQNYIKKHKIMPACFRCCSLEPKFI